MTITKKLNLIFIIILIYICFFNYFVCFATNIEEENMQNNEEIAEEENAFKVFSEAAILMEQSTGKILFEKNAYKRMYPASTTKILTCIIALEECDLDETAIASEDAVNSVKNGYTKANIVPGEEFTIKQLLLLMQLQSANEAANIIAEHISGSTEKFAELMNKKAKEIGCKDSNFVNANGMHDENHYSTAYDLAQICRYCMKNKTYREIMLTEKCDIPDTEIWNNYKIENDREDEPYREFYNTNKLLQKGNQYYYPYCTGGKTGFTTPAKNCFIATSNKDGFELVSVILHAELTDDEKSARYVDTINLFNYVYDNYNLEDIKKEYPDIAQEVSSSSIEEETYNLTDSIYQKLKLDNIKAVLMISIGFVVLIIGFILLRIGKKK